MLNRIKKLLSKNRERTDIKVGKNVDIINSYLDYGFGYLITIGDNVTITNATILTHDASTKKV